MIHKPFQELSLSWLGMGAMRLPKIEGKGEAIEEAKARALIDTAYANGVNYFDTAYRYHGGESELVLGRALEQYPRETWRLATKMPGHMMRRLPDGQYEFTGLLAGQAGKSPAQIFEEQLNKCRVDYFDFYLLHNVCETAYDFYTDKDIGVVEYLLAQKRAGRIRHLGFSAHGRAETIDRFLTEQPHFEFAQIQLNYLDWTLQDAKRKYDVLTRHGLPVIAMEPCRGGRLASLDSSTEAKLKAARPNDSIASWAFRFLQSLPNVMVVLSGMTEMAQLTENLALFSKADPVSEAELALLNDAVAALAEQVPCTACRYCTEHCPKGLDIPELLSMYNEHRFGNAFTLKFTMDAMAKEALPAACIACGACSRICPQGIDIPGAMQAFAGALGE